MRRFDSADRTGLVWKKKSLGFGHHIGFVADAENSEGAAHTDRVVTEKGRTDLVAHYMKPVVEGEVVSGSTAHTGSVVRRRTAGSVGHIAPKHWGCTSTGQSPADCCQSYGDLAVVPEDYIDRSSDRIDLRTKRPRELLAKLGCSPGLVPTDCRYQMYSHSYFADPR